MKSAAETLEPVPSAFRLFLTVLLIVFLAEAVVMLLLPRLPGGRDPVAAPLVDASLLVAVTAPLLWWFVARPLRGTALKEHVRAATVLAHARDGIITIDDRGLVDGFNPAAERTFGYRADEVVGRPVALLMPERHRRAHAEALERARGAEASRTVDRTLDVEGVRTDGTEFAMELSLATWRVREGTFHTAVVRDISERKQAEEAVRTRTRQVEAVRAVAAEITRELHLDTVLTLITGRAVELFGLRHGAVLLWDESTERLRPRAWHGFGDWLSDVALGLGEGFAGSVAERRKGATVDGEAAWPFAVPASAATTVTCTLVGQPLVFRDRLLGVIVLGTQGTTRMFAEPDVEILGLFADQAATAIENARLYEEVQSLAILEERHRIAREIHDSVAQSLGLLHLQLSRARDESLIGSERTALLAEVTMLTEHAYDELRESIVGLRAAPSRALGWVSALTEYVHEFGLRTGIDVTLDAADGLPTRLPPATDVQLVRIIQEALVNVQKHAKANHARVGLRFEQRWIRATVEDDGQGFDLDAVVAAKRDHFGLATMRERAESIGGRLDIDAAPGRGTRVVATLPGEV